MRQATLHQLKVFETVARHLSFSRAAAELHLTQPAVSIQVKQLETYAGSPLFEQLGKRVYLTAAGQELLHHSRAIIGQFRAAQEAMAQMSGVVGGTLHVAVISAGDYFFPQLLAEFKRRHPAVALHLVVRNRHDVVALLAENLTDLAIMVRPPERNDTTHVSFAPAPYVVVAAPGHPLARKRRIPAKMLADCPFVARERASDTWNAMEAAFGRLLENFTILMEINSNETIKQAVMAGLGIGFLSAHAVDLELRLGTLVALDIQGFPFLRHWNIVERNGKRLPPVAVAFKEFLVNEGAALIERGTGRDPP